MYGDTAVMRRHAATLRDQAADIRAAADLLVGRAEQISWAGRAAEAMRERLYGAVDTVVFTSATLRTGSSFEYFCRQVGLLNAEGKDAETMQQIRDEVLAAIRA